MKVQHKDAFMVQIQYGIIVVYKSVCGATHTNCQKSVDY